MAAERSVALHHDQAAVHADDTTRDVGRLVQADEHDDVGDLLRCPETPQGRRGAGLLDSRGQRGVMSVTPKPSATALQVIPRLATSRAVAVVGPIGPTLAAE